MKLARAARMSATSRIAFAGAGGKTRAIFQMAEEYSGRVLITATTHLGNWQIGKSCEHITEPIEEILFKAIERSRKKILVVTSAIVHDRRVKGLEPSQMDGLVRVADRLNLPILIEADGSRRLPVKAPADHEPSIPDFCDKVMFMASLECLGRKNGDRMVFRPGIFAKITGCEIGTKITGQHLIKLFLSTEGGLKRIPPQANKVAVFSHCNSASRYLEGRKLAHSLSLDYDSVLLTKNNRILTMQERTVGIVLAAGESKRYPGNKLLIDWDGRPLIRHVVIQALSSALDSIVVVVGNRAEAIKKVLVGLPIQVVENKRWSDGISSSLRTGLEALQDPIGAAIVMQADQPFLRAAAINKLLEYHAKDLAPVAALKVKEQRSSPTLFDRMMFPLLMTLKGDKGGSQLFGEHPPEFVKWGDDRILMDIDTPADLLEARSFDH
jgi:probable selenium-dependent hydroxylase accessory protein YqeC